MPMFGADPWGQLQTQDEAYQEYLRKQQQQINRLPQLSGMAQQYMQGVEGGAPFAGQGFAENTLPSLYGGIRGMMAGGMSDAEYGQQRTSLGQGFNQAVGRANQASARAGAWNPQQSANSGMMRGAMQSYSGGIAGLESERQRIARESREKGTGIAAGLAGQSADEMRAAQTAYGNYLRQLQQQPGGSIALPARGKG